MKWFKGKFIIYPGIFVIFGFFFMSLSGRYNSVKEEQMSHARVKHAYQKKYDKIKNMLSAQEISPKSLVLYFRAFKAEKELEVWGRNKDEKQFRKITTYDFCGSSGVSGPKRRIGDGQIPEGFYFVNRFNPWSNYYLSLGLNYPNKSDKILGNASKPGGDIFIHGDCVSTGCIAVSDAKIMEIYILAVEACNNGEDSIPIDIFPARFNSSYYTQIKKDYPEHINFWENLKEGYVWFEKNRSLPGIRIDESGKYLYN
jgi:murein L,D-transpeptidase YafK